MHNILQILFLLAILAVSVCLYSKTLSSKKKTKKPFIAFEEPVIRPIAPDFEWEKQQPYPYRPFKKGPHKMTMGIRKLDPNDIICLESTYLDRVHLRATLFEKTKQYGCHESAIPALKEAYSFVFDFLVKRYPKYFRADEKGLIHNEITGKLVPSNPNNLQPEEMLRFIACNIEEDILIMLKNPDTEEYDEYVLRAVVSLFPNGFNPADKLNQPLTAIHGPVPGYVEKLQRSMNKFFSKIKPFEFIVRNNWALQTHTNICAPTGSHAKPEEALTIHPLFPAELDFNKCFFRVEKQCFTRLPETGADLMFIRTYVTSLMSLRDELNDEQRDILCEAIDGLTGDFGIYKKRIQWGEAAKAFMRRESNGSQPIPKEYKFIH